MPQSTPIASDFRHREERILKEWIENQLGAITLRRDLIKEHQLRDESKRFLSLFVEALQQNWDSASPEWHKVTDCLADIACSRMQLGFSPGETAIFVFSLKQPLFNLVQQREGQDAQTLVKTLWELTLLLDKLGLTTIEVYQKSREEMISRQQQELLELSTPVVQLWDEILALPLIGTLDSARTQVVMETLLQRIVETGARIAVIDITGVPTVDTLVAQHLMKTVSAARLMGADCIISGIRPQIAQTIVHLGVNLNDIITKATMADAFKVALQRMGTMISRETVST